MSISGFIFLFLMLGLVCSWLGLYLYFLHRHDLSITAFWDDSIEAKFAKNERKKLRFLFFCTQFVFFAWILYMAIYGV